MRKISTAVKKFWNDNELYNSPLTIATMGDILKSQGFDIVEVSQDNPTNIKQLIDVLGVADACNTKSGFTYCCDGTKVVFIKANLNDSDKLFVLLHEEGHIFLEHFFHNGNLEHTDVKHENEANAFALALMTKIKRQRLALRLRAVAKDVFAVAVFIAVFALVGLVYNATYPASQEAREITKALETTVKITVSADTEENKKPVTSENLSIEEAEICYWTDSGTVYHLYADCGHIKNSLEVFEGTPTGSGKSRCCSDCMVRRLRGYSK